MTLELGKIYVPVRFIAQRVCLLVDVDDKYVSVIILFLSRNDSSILELTDPVVYLPREHFTSNYKRLI